MLGNIDIIKVFIDENFIGQLAVTNERLCVFEYDSQFLKSGFSISPFYLPLRSGVFVSKRDPFDGLFGVFNDSLPDGWGNLLVDRYLKSIGINPNTLSILDRLSIVGSSGMGAIRYVPDKQIKGGKEIDDINQLASEVTKILSEVDYSESLDVLAEKGGSSGGARPKVLLNIEGQEWIVKFPSSSDESNIGQVEYQYSIVARKCGIEMPETRIFEEKYFGVRRFDRKGDKRIHMHSVSGLLYASHRFPSLDYIDLVKATLALTKDMVEAYKMFRLMVFNILTGNKDDHTKNFSYLFNNDKWCLSPAYDLVPSVGFNFNHSTTIAGKGNPSIEDIWEVAKQTGLKLKKVKDIFDDVYENSREIHKVKI